MKEFKEKSIDFSFKVLLNIVLLRMLSLQNYLLTSNWFCKMVGKKEKSRTVRIALLGPSGVGKT